MNNELPTKMNWRKKGHRWHLELTAHDTVRSRLVLLRTSMRFGHAPLTAGGIAGVRTEEEFRHQGHARTIIREAIREMNRRRYALSLLYGINDMYGKFGYATVESVPQIQIDLDEVLLYPCDRYAVRPFSKRKDSTRLVRYYNQANSDRNGTAVRTESVFKETRDTIIVATDGRDRLLGYAIYEDECDDDDDRFHVWILRMAYQAIE